MIIVIILLFIIALPTLLNVIASALGLFWLYDFISNYGKHILFSCILLSISLAALYLYKNKEIIKWKYFKNKSEQICHKVIKQQFNNDPAVNPRQVFDEIVKLWVPLVKKLYPNSKPKDIAIKLGITPKGIEVKINSYILKNKQTAN
ncbi:hypothetical protein ACR77J_17335 [Tissierella praeacuta]|uniref:hypothetical protein n=1 Tax=Tissierella praeacuta TaxID=43131 RepID=UPI003DA2C7EE